MFKRILILGSGITLGVVMSVLTLRVAAAWNWLPNRDLVRTSGYLKEVMQLVNEHYVEAEPAAYAALARHALHGMVESLDPHSEFLEARDNAEFEEDIAGEFGGIGVQVETRDNRVVVIAPLPDTPGERAGLRRGDEIVSIDGRMLGSSSADATIEQLRGKPRTSVALRVFRPSTQQTLNVTLVREVIRIESVRDVRILPDGIGYVQITEFSDHTAAQVARALVQLRRDGMTSLIMDVRNNPGGLLDAAVAVAEQFFPAGELIVSTRGRKAEDREEYRAGSAVQPLQIPTAILINAGSASAAEVLTGALKDTGRAVVVGERSFGKGSVQSVFKLEQGEGLRLTTARYYTPAGVSIHEKGIAPHVEVVMTAEEDNKLARQRSRFDLTNPEEFKARFGFEPIADRQMQAAIDVLKGMRLLHATPATRVTAVATP